MPQGLAYGRYQVFHRKHTDGRSMFCVASLIEPGTFDAARMPEEEYRGISMFAVLPGPLGPLQTVDAMLVDRARAGAQLSGTVQDAKGMPFSPQRVAALREDVARFQSLLAARSGGLSGAQHGTKKGSSRSAGRGARGGAARAAGPLQLSIHALDDPEVPDAEYDRLMVELRDLEARHRSS